MTLVDYSAKWLNKENTLINSLNSNCIQLIISLSLQSNINLNTLHIAHENILTICKSLIERSMSFINNKEKKENNKKKKSTSVCVYWSLNAVWMYVFQFSLCGCVNANSLCRKKIFPGWLLKWCNYVKSSATLPHCVNPTWTSITALLPSTKT